MKANKRKKNNGKHFKTRLALGFFMKFFLAVTSGIRREGMIFQLLCNGVLIPQVEEQNG